MSKFGETADRILELLKNGEKLEIEVIRDKLLLSDAAILNFMNEFGLIELNQGTAKITKPGLDILNQMSYL